MHWDDINWEKPGSYSANGAYCQSKLANVLVSDCSSIILPTVELIFLTLSSTSEQYLN